MKLVRKNIIALVMFAVVLFSGIAVINIAKNENVTYAQASRVWTYEEVDTLDKLRSVPTEQIASWSKYDSRKYDIVTSVKNQGNTNLCWIYSSFAAMETNILRQGFSGKTKETLNLDEVEFAKATVGKWDDPLNLADTENNQKNGDEVIWDHTGAMPMVAQLAARGQGIYEEGETDSEVPSERYSSYLLRNAITCENKVDQIKKLIAAYGGVAFTFYSGYVDYNYYYATGLKDHACFIVGWDDSLDNSSFRSAMGSKPTNNGGWIVKNSYGTDRFMGGYFYLSYDSVLYELTAFEMAPKDEYDWCYNYSDKEYTTASYSDVTTDDADNVEYAAIYKAQKGDAPMEYLKGVSVGVTGKDVQISVSVYAEVDEESIDYKKSSAFNPKNGTAFLAAGTCTAPATGIYTVPLNESIELKKDSYFTVVVKITNGNVVYDSMAYRDGKTFTYAFISGQWNNLSNQFNPPNVRGVLCIKALTVTRESGEDDVFDISQGSLSLSCDKYFYTGSPRTPDVTVRLDGNMVSSDNYTVSYENNINAGSATVKVEGIGNCTGSLQTTFEIAKAARSEFKVQLNGWVYGQTANEPSVSNYGLEEGKVNYTYGSSASGPFSEDIPKAAGTYYVRAEMTETDNYESAVAISEFTICKAAAPDLPKEFDSLVVTGEMKTLSDIELPQDWAWQEPEMQLVVGKMRVAVVYVGDDSASYEQTVFQLELDVPEPENTEGPGEGEEPPVEDPDESNDGDNSEEDTTNGSNEPTDEGNNTVAVAVGVSGGIVGVGAIVGFAIWFIRRRRKM
ncbi:MAG: hypothetical protein J1F65_01425 [Clostridiales bacterium]|nr:hypothetical protein [Clostridiales bacterium]